MLHLDKNDIVIRPKCTFIWILLKSQVAIPSMSCLFLAQAMNPGMRMLSMAQAAGIPMTPTALAALQRQQAGLAGPPIMGKICILPCQQPFLL